MIRLLAQVVLFDGFDPLDVVAPYEVLIAGGVLAVELVSAEGPRRVPSGMNMLTLDATARLDPSRADVVVVPGAAGRLPTGDHIDDDTGDDSALAILTRTLSTPLPVLLKEVLDRPGSILATVCGGSMVLALAGLITGRSATTHHAGLAALARTGVVAVDARVVDDGDLITASSVTSGLDLGLYLLEREFGPDVAQAVAELFAYERRWNTQVGDAR